MGSKKIIAWLATTVSGRTLSSVRIAGISMWSSTTRAASRSSSARSSAASGGISEAMDAETRREVGEQDVAAARRHGQEQPAIGVEPVRLRVGRDQQARGGSDAAAQFVPRAARGAH